MEKAIGSWLGKLDNKFCDYINDGVYLLWTLPDTDYQEQL